MRRKESKGEENNYKKNQYRGKKKRKRIIDQN